jgi:formate hydrogenlyase subunit 6/NADH:ubiquinone oxidoreductase subunit I
MLLLVVEELGSVGLEIWLSALAWGAQDVFLADGGSVPRGVLLTLEEQLKIADSILHGMGYPSNVIQLLGADEIDKASSAKMPQISAARFESFNEKRTMLFLAIDHLFQQSGSDMERIFLPEDAAFGRIDVDSSACTLCMGCASVCPARALQAGNDEPKLQFIEQNCVQCGLCEISCPEKAITLEARLLTNAGQRRRLVVLHEEAPYLCCSCGKPFASQGMIRKMLDQLSGHPMFQSERAIKRLQMCEECRVVDAIQDQDAIDAGIAMTLPETNNRKN